jgi:hypothetical protein
VESEHSVRTEAQVIQALSAEAQALLKRVLEVERAKLHLTGADASVLEELHAAVKGIVP